MRYLIARPLFGIVLAVLAGCAAAPPSRFYVLSPMPAEATASATGHGPAVGVGPVSIPGYLDRPRIALRRGTYELHYSETDRWAEDLPKNIADVIAQNLALLIPTDNVYLFPWSRQATLDYQVTAELLRFDADPNGKVVLSAYWKLYREGSHDPLTAKKTRITETAGGSDYPEIVAAQSRALAALSREIASTIRAAGSH
jgi:uncharacterized lipoprotein YmbA